MGNFVENGRYSQYKCSYSNGGSGSTNNEVGQSSLKYEHDIPTSNNLQRLWSRS